jgi:hypothetical protein
MIKGRMAGNRRLLHGELLALPLVFVSGFAWGQDQAALEKAAAKEIQAYADCIKGNAAILAKKSSDAAEAIAQRAFEACPDQRHDLWVKLQKAPLNSTPSDATATIQKTNENWHPLVLETIKAARGT